MIAFEDFKKLEIKIGKLALFGSGEMSPTGRRVHEYLIKKLKPPVRIALIETPTGFEANPHNWYQKLEKMMMVGLQNHKPVITRVEALRNDTPDNPNSTNNPNLSQIIENSDYIHTGAGSPSYAAKHLKDSLVYQAMINHINKGLPMSLGSAAAIAFSKYLLPVYSIYKVGEDLHWKYGLDFFTLFGMNLTVIPHWNNQEGGESIDTSRAFIGKERFQKMLEILPGPTTILGIDEQTSLVFDFDINEAKVMGAGTVTIMKDGRETNHPSGSSFSITLLQD